jgi:hypothetical protein
VNALDGEGNCSGAIIGVPKSGLRRRVRPLQPEGSL